MNTNFIWLIPLGAVTLLALTVLLVYYFYHLLKNLSESLTQNHHVLKEEFFKTTLSQQQLVNESLQKITEKSHEQNANNNLRLQSTMRENLNELDRQLKDALIRTSDHLTKQFDLLTKHTQTQILKISENVDKRLHEGFSHSSETFANVLKRLTIIDEAQKKISDLSSNVISLQEILADKRSRGAFGEIQLKTLLCNVLPQKSYSLQHTLSNGTRADCIVFLPKPTGNVVIDAKFPLENYKIMTDLDQPSSIKDKAKQQFTIDIKKHIQSIASKYILPGETADGAVMFIPAEAVFAEIHAHHPDVVEKAYQSRVWMASPTTMMAILTTASAALKDSATRQQIHLIQEHLQLLAKDFVRFEQRMDNLAKHIHKANEDVTLAHTSAKKITQRFNKIESVDLNSGSLEDQPPSPASLELETENIELTTNVTKFDEELETLS